MVKMRLQKITLYHVSILRKPCNVIWSFAQIYKHFSDRQQFSSTKYIAPGTKRDLARFRPK
jgi:hypothetical protein